MNTQLSEVYEFNPITVTLPNQEALRRLAMNDSGFVFDPVNGDSFTVNSCGLTVLRLLKDGQSLSDVLDDVGVRSHIDEA